MDKGSLAAAELMVFIGLAAWLVYYQFVSSRKGSTGSDSASKDESKKDESGD